ncbi:MAG: glycine cleavage system protein GcvH [Desulfovibrionales bacterium]
MYPSDLQFTNTHEWIKVENDIALVGITHFAQEQLGDITFVELPEVGAMVEEGEEMGSIESVKAASELYSPVTGEVIEVNTDLEDAPERVNDDPYGEGWLIRVRITQDPLEALSPDEYEELIAEKD